MKRICIVALISTTFCFGAVAKTVVIVHPENTVSLSSKDVQRIFLGKEKKFSTGEEASAVNLPAENAARIDFDDAILGRSTAQVAAYWAKLVFTGKGVPPEEVDSETAVIQFIKTNKNAIGYVDESAVTSDVKVITLN